MLDSSPVSQMREACEEETVRSVTSGDAGRLGNGRHVQLTQADGHERNVRSVSGGARGRTRHAGGSPRRLKVDSGGLGISYDDVGGRTSIA